MALSGSFTSSKWRNNSTGSNSWLVFSWTATQSVDKNSSTISWTLKGARDVTGYVNAGGFKVAIDSTVVYSKSTDYRIEMYNGTTIASGTRTLAHNSDGSRSFSVSIQGGIYYYDVNCTGSYTFTIDSIGTASTITCNEAEIGTCPSISIKSASNVYTHTVTYSFGSLSGTIASNTSATKITDWKIPDSFYTQIPSAKAGRGELICTTYKGDKQIGKSSCVLFVGTSSAKCTPNITFSVKDVNTITSNLTGDSNVLVRYKSIARCYASAKAKNSASVGLVKVNNIDVTGNEYTDLVPETGAFDIYAEDSRGYYNTLSTTQPLGEDVRLTSNIKKRRIDPLGGRAEIEVSGNFFNGSFGKEDNRLLVYYSNGDGYNLSGVPTISGNSYSVTISLDGLDYTQSFDYDIVVEDRLERIEKTATIKRGVPVFDWGENDFAFHVPVSFDGATMTDFVVEQGMSGVWYYRKWNNGDAECWTRDFHNTAFTKTWGSLYVGKDPIEPIDYPFEFVYKPVENVAINESEDDAWIVYTGGGGNTCTTTARYELCRPTESTAYSDFWISYRVIGKWK